MFHVPAKTRELSAGLSVFAEPKSLGIFNTDLPP